MRVILMASCLGLAWGCGGSLQLTKIEGAHQRPSNVALFFTVEANGGEPVPSLLASDFMIYEDGDLVSVDESQQTIVNPEVAAEHYTLLLVDMSGSVRASEDVPLIEEATKQFSETLSEYQKVAVYAFDGSEKIHPIQPFTKSSGATQRAANRLSNLRERDPSTNLHGAVVQATKILNETLQEAESPLRFGTVVVFTDGTDRAKRVSYDEMMDAVDEGGFDLFAIGVGTEIDEDSLSSIGQSGYVLVEDRDAMVKAFEAISERIVNYTQSHYLLSYCSPARAGKHEVTIEAITDEGSGSLSYEFDAEGFGPRCNPDRPPPFDTSGRGRRSARRKPEIRGATGVRIEVDEDDEDEESDTAEAD